MQRKTLYQIDIPGKKMIHEELYLKATTAIKEVHGADSVQHMENGMAFPSEILYGQRMLALLEEVYPESSFAFKLAVQCQHLKRWGIPRTDYPFDRRGYHEWRRVVMEYQLAETRTVLSAVPVEEEDLLWILDALKNQGNKANGNAQIITDTACLVFMKWYMVPFAAKHESEKVVDILKKTMRKMSEKGIHWVSKLGLSSEVMQMVALASHKA